MKETWNKYKSDVTLFYHQAFFLEGYTLPETDNTLQKNMHFLGAHLLFLDAYVTTHM